MILKVLSKDWYLILVAANNIDERTKLFFK